MRRYVILLVCLSLSAAFIMSCDQQKALDQILTKPEMKSYLMTKMMEDEQIKTDMVNQLLADTTWVKTIIDRLANQPANREIMFSKLMTFEGLPIMMLEKMAESPDLKTKMREIGRRR